LIGIFVSLILLALAILVYRKDLKAKNFGWLFIFRILVIIFLSLILIGSILTFTCSRSPKIPIILLADVSPSMTDKFKPAKELIANFRQTTEYKTQYLSFADSILGIIKNDSLSVQGTKTDIARTLNSAKEKKPGAVILLSDGQHNTLSNPIQIAADLPFPVYTIGLGKTSEPDVSIRRLSVAKQVYLKETANVTVRVTSQGLANQRTKVSLIQRNKELQKQEIKLSETLTEQELNFAIVPSEIGKMFYKIQIAGFEEEANLINNEKEFVLNVLKSKLKIFLLSNSPNYNTRFLLASLKSEIFEVNSIIAFQNSQFQIITDQGKRDFIFRLDCDVLILDNFDANRLTADISNQIKRFVQTEGGLLVLWGERTRFNQTLAEILPFVPSNKINRKETFVKLTNHGFTVPIFFDNGENLLENTPPLLGMAEPKQVQPKAQIWAKTDPLEIPLIGFSKFGKGKVIEITGFPIWRMGFYGTDLDNAKERFHKLISQICRFLALKEFEMFSLDSDQPIYETGENITFTFYAYNEDGSPWQGLDVSLIIPDQNPIPMIDIGSGIYERTIEALPAQDYTVKAIARLDTLKVGDAKTEFKVSETNIEMVETRLNSELLKSIAQKSGGEYFDAASFPTTGFDFNLAEYQTIFRFDPRRSSYLYVILAGLFLIELYFRKQRGLM
jgi:hypothetical protein